MEDPRRAVVREIAERHLSAGDAVGWFEELYAQADGNASAIPWVHSKPNPNLVAWLDRLRALGRGKRALVIGCGLGDDAEELSARGFTTTAFDISPTAIAWCRRRFPKSTVDYHAVDLFRAPSEWRGAFDFVLESYTLQILPRDVRGEALHAVSQFAAPGGTMLIIARGRDPHESEGGVPWRLTHAELSAFEARGFREVSFEDFFDDEDPPVRRFRIVYAKATTP